MVGIYKITSPINKVYIGQSWTIESRIRSYEKITCEGQRKLFYSLKKYGWESHKFEIVHELPIDISQDILNEYETYYWQQHKDCGYDMLNVREPGSKGKHSLETKQKMRESSLGRVNSEESKEKNRLSHLGKICFPNGRIFSDSHRKNMSEVKKGKKHSEETLKKMSEIKTGSNHPFFGKKHSQETIEKIRNAAKKRKV